MYLVKRGYDHVQLNFLVVYYGRPWIPDLGNASSPGYQLRSTLHLACFVHLTTLYLSEEFCDDHYLIKMELLGNCSAEGISLSPLQFTVQNVMEVASGDVVKDDHSPCSREEYLELKSSKILCCPVQSCLKTFKTNSHLQAHVLTHTGERPFKCTRCDKSFRQSGHLRTHLQTHSKEKKYRCTHCQKLFGSSGNLLNHTKTHTKERPYKCKECGRGFSQSGHLQTHVLTHMQQKKHRCKECGKSFVQLVHLQTHIRVHTGEKPFQCEACGKRFSQFTNLDAHRKVHTGEKPFMCESNGCGKCFATKSRLHQHLRSHSDQKGRFKCELCSKLFQTSAHLRRHGLTHSKEKPHTCCMCFRSFSQVGHLNRHVQQVHDDRPQSDDTQHTAQEGTEQDLLTELIVCSSDLREGLNDQA